MNKLRSIEEIVSDLRQPEMQESRYNEDGTWPLEELVRELERQLIRTSDGQLRLTGIWSELIVRIKSEYIQTRVPARALFMIAQINCQRRKENYYFHDVDQKLEDVWSYTGRLETTDRRRLRLKELYFYHGGIHAENKGDYAQSSEMLLGASEIAEQLGQKATAAINRFRSLQAEMYDRLAGEAPITASIKHKLKNKFGLQSAKRLQSALVGSNEENGLWSSYNIFVPLAIVYFLAKITPSQGLMDYIGQSLREFCEKYPQEAQQQQAGVLVTRAIHSFWLDDHDQARECASAVIPMRQMEYWAIAQMIIARLGENNHDKHYAQYGAMQFNSSFPKYIRITMKRWLAEAYRE